MICYGRFENKDDFILYLTVYSFVLIRHLPESGVRMSTVLKYNPDNSNPPHFSEQQRNDKPVVLGVGLFHRCKLLSQGALFRENLAIMGLVHTPRTIASICKGLLNRRRDPTEGLRVMGIGEANRHVYHARLGLFDVDYLGHMNNGMYIRTSFVKMYPNVIYP